MKKNSEFVPATQHATLITGETIRMLRELKGWTQEQLAEQSGLNAKNISLLENGRIDIGKKRVEQLARAFRLRRGYGGQVGVHPAIIMFPEYEADLIGNPSRRIEKKAEAV